MATRFRAAVVVLGVVLAGCGGGPQSGGGTISGDAIKLGVITDLSTSRSYIPGWCTASCQRCTGGGTSSPAT